MKIILSSVLELLSCPCGYQWPANRGLLRCKIVRESQSRPGTMQALLRSNMLSCASGRTALQHGCRQKSGMCHQNRLLYASPRRSSVLLVCALFTGGKAHFSTHPRCQQKWLGRSSIRDGDDAPSFDRESLSHAIHHSVGCYYAHRKQVARGV